MVISSKKLLKILNKIGYEFDHQTGSHIIMRLNKEPYTRVTVPNHNTIAKGTLKSIMRTTGLDNEDLIRLSK